MRILAPHAPAIADSAVYPIVVIRFVLDDFVPSRCHGNGTLRFRFTPFKVPRSVQ